MFLQEATGPLFTTLSEKMGVLMGQIDELQASGKLKEWADQAKTSFESAWVVIEQVGVFLFNTGKWIYDNWIIIGPVLAGVLAGYLAYQAATKTIALLKIAQDALNFSMRANPIGIVVTAIAGLVAAGVILYQHWDEIAARGQGLWTSIITYFDGIKNSITSAWTSVRDYTMGVWNSITAFFSEYWPLLLVVFLGPLGFLIGKIVSNWTEIQVATATIWTGIKDFFVGIWEAIVGVITPPVEAIQGLVADAWGFIESTIGSRMNGAVEAVSGPVNTIRSMFDNLVQSAFDWGKNLIQGFIDGVYSLINKFKSMISSLNRSVRTAMGGGGSSSVVVSGGSYPGMASGGTVTSPGLSWVGENGPELLSLPRGASVIPNPGVSRGGITINITGNNIARDYDVDRIGDMLIRRLRREGMLA